MPKPLMLAVDDEPEQTAFMQDFFEDTHTVHVAANVPAALELVEQHEFAVALVDYRLPGGTGLMVLRRLFEKDPTCMRYLLSATDILNSERRKEPPYTQIGKGLPPKELIKHVLTGDTKDV